MSGSSNKSASFNELYSNIGTIGRGSFGKVIKVRRREDSKVLVCKVLSYGNMSEKEKQLIVSEVNILRELRHPNIVRYEDRIIDKRSATIYIVMEYCVGGDLGKIIKQKKSEHSYFEESRIWKSLAQLVLAFEKCHYHKEGSRVKPILHRDIKPCNILLDSAGNIKVGDFGLATELAGENKFAYTNVGTPYYMSPELVNETRYNEKSDIWALGCLVYEMANLSPPFNAQNVVSLGKKISKGVFAPVNKRYSKALHDIVQRMLTVDPNKRPSISEIKEISQVKRYIETPNSSRESDSPRSVEDTPAQHDIQLREAALSKRLRELQEREDALQRREKVVELREKEVERREIHLKEREERISQSNPVTPPSISARLAPKTISPDESVTRKCETRTVDEIMLAARRLSQERYQERNKENTRGSLNTKITSDKYSKPRSILTRADTQRWDYKYQSLARRINV